MPTAVEDAQKIGISTSDINSNISSSTLSSNPLNLAKISYRDALVSGMWRIRTAPFVFYIGDSAYTVSISFTIILFTIIFLLINKYTNIFQILDGSNISTSIYSNICSYCILLKNNFQLRVEV